jgi:hypothetical protein
MLRLANHIFTPFDYTFFLKMQYDAHSYSRNHQVIINQIQEENVVAEGITKLF